MTGPQAAVGRVFTVPAGEALADAVAAEVLHPTLAPHATPDRLTLLLPTRRACLAMREALLRRSGGTPVLAPRILPLGDLDPDGDGLDGDLAWADAGLPDAPPAIAPLRRKLLLAQAIRTRGDLPVSPDQALSLADALARLIDLAHTERVSFDRLAALAPDHLADHWQRTLTFLTIVTEAWPKILAEEGAIDPADRRDRLLAALAAAWTDRPPQTPIWVAGSTGSIPATADLLAVIGGLPAGRVILPGLDRDLDPESWTHLDDTHPQSGLKRLLQRLGLPRDQIPDWPAAPGRTLPRPDRSRLIREAMRPPATAEHWQTIAGITQADSAGVRRVVCATDREEAAVIALAMREALETEGRTCALITADRVLARRVVAALKTWNLTVDDSAGQPLGRMPVGTFLRLLADAAAAAFAPVALLSLLKHPLCGLGLARRALDRRTRMLERVALRGPRPAAGSAGLRQAVTAAAERQEQPADPELIDLIDRLAAATAPLTTALDARTAPPGALVTAHVRAAEAVAATDAATGADRLWRHEDGEQAADLLVELRQMADGLPPQETAAYPAWITALLADPLVRPRYGMHPRLSIWGTLEARLQSADLLILGGLNEGTWPAEPPADPWMSRPMRADFGLSPPERRIGLAAHDFTQALAGPEVLLTRAARVAGTPTVPSRWLMRLDAVAERCGLALTDADALRAWAEMLEAPTTTTTRGAPAPTPPQAARPRRLSVTEIGTLLADPYQIYARHVLGLRALEPLEADPGAAERGQAIHEALARFVQAGIDPRSSDAGARLQALGRAAFGPLLAQPGVAAFWWPRFEAVATWFLERQVARGASARPLAAEVSGRMAIPRPKGPDGADRDLILSARADRIDRLDDGRLEIIDYKTGGVPTAAQIDAGFAPQLPLEAAMAERGAFAGVTPSAVGRLIYWRLSGRRPAGSEEPRTPLDVAALVPAAWAGMVELVTCFDRPGMPFRSVPTPDFVVRFSDYGHLARILEWSTGGSAEDET